jgi:hypothetical protein
MAYSKKRLLSDDEIVHLIETTELTAIEISRRAGFVCRKRGAGARVVQICQERTGMGVLEYRQTLGWVGRIPPSRVQEILKAYEEDSYLDHVAEKLGTTAKTVRTVLQANDVEVQQNYQPWIFSEE